MTTTGMVWRPPPGWPEPSPGWTPPPGWKPPPDWPAPPPGWQFWQPAPAQQPGTQAQQPQTQAQQPQTQAPSQAQTQAQAPLPPVKLTEPTRRDLVLETWFVQLAFLVPGVLAAVDTLTARGGAAAVTRFPSIAANPAVNLILGILTYLSVAVTVPIALLLLSRSGQRPVTLGLGRPRWRADVWPSLGLAAGGYGVTLVATLLLTGVIGRKSKLLRQIPIGHVPDYYIIFGVAIAAVTAVAEETLINGYLLTRLEQLGWNPRWALLLSLTLRTSYHVYYGLGFLITIPFGYLLTRSFQKRRRLMRPIIAHFLYDAILISAAILISH